ncbi:MAG: hypothetical protein ACYTEX_11130 [Planctomycetota bacterium]|jgi:hypothetical protein
MTDFKDFCRQETIAAWQRAATPDRRKVIERYVRDGWDEKWAWPDCPAWLWPRYLRMLEEANKATVLDRLFKIVSEVSPVVAKSIRDGIEAYMKKRPKGHQ